MSIGILERIQNDARDRLASDPYFSPSSGKKIEVLAERLKDIQFDIDKAVGSIGIVAIVLTPFAGGAYQNAPAMFFEDIKVVVGIYENVLINRSPNGTQKPVSEVAEMVAKLLHLFIPEGSCSAIVLEDPGIAIGPADEEGRKLQYLVHFTTRGGDPAPEKVARPTIDVAGVTVTLATATSGATLYYTTDGSYPGPGNSAAQVYSAPFNAVSGQTVRAGATKTGLRASDTSKATIS